MKKQMTIDDAKALVRYRVTLAGRSWCCDDDFPQVLKLDHNSIELDFDALDDWISGVVAKAIMHYVNDPDKKHDGLGAIHP